MKLIEFVNLTSKPFILNYRDCNTTGEEWDNFHAHQGIEFLYIHEGSGHIVLEQKIHPVSDGTLIFFQPFQLHRVRMNTKSSRYVRTVLNLDPVYLDSYLQSFPIFHGYFQSIWKEKLTRQVFNLENRDPEVNSLFERFHVRLAQASSEFHNEEFILFMISLLQYLRSSSTDMTVKEPNSSARTIRHSEKILEWIEAHYKEKFSLERIAFDLHLSPYHISHLFKEDTGFTLIEYVIARRLREACLLLSITSLPINAICEKIGLGNTSYFTQLFKKMIGMTPKEYKSTIKNTFNRISLPNEQSN